MNDSRTCPSMYLEKCAHGDPDTHREMLVNRKPISTVFAEPE